MSGIELFDSTTLLTYAAAAFALVLAPGPGQALVIARSVDGGARAGLLTSVGLEIGTLVHTVGAAVGLSALLATSATAFTVVKYSGAVYLIALGVIMVWKTRRSARDHRVQSQSPRATGRTLVFHAAMTGILNPKVAVFFLAFLPQFVHPERGGVFLQFLVLGLILATLGFLFDATVAVIAGRARTRLAASARFAMWRERVTGSVLIGLGLRLALPERR